MSDQAPDPAPDPADVRAAATRVLISLSGATTKAGDVIRPLALLPRDREAVATVLRSQAVLLEMLAMEVEAAP